MSAQSQTGKQGLRAVAGSLLRPRLPPPGHAGRHHPVSIWHACPDRRQADRQPSGLRGAITQFLLRPCLCAPKHFRTVGAKRLLHLSPGTWYARFPRLDRPGSESPARGPCWESCSPASPPSPGPRDWEEQHLPGHRFNRGWSPPINDLHRTPKPPPHAPSNQKSSLY